MGTFTAFVTGVVVGVIYHAKLQPYLNRAWTAIKAKLLKGP